MRRWLLTAWLGFVVIRYGTTALRALREPFIPGLDMEWAAAWLVFLAVALLSIKLIPRKIDAIRLWFGIVVLTSFILLVLSHQWVAALTALVLFAVSAGFGEFILGVLRTGSSELIERVVIAVPIGIGFLALGQMVLALFGAFRPITSWCLVVVFAIPAVPGLRRLFSLKIETELADYRVAVVPLAGIFFLNLLWAIAPEIQFDAISVHLAVPKIYLQQRGIVDLPYFFHSYFVHLLDMMFGLCLAIGDANVAKFLVLGLGVVATGGIFVLGRRVFNAEVGAWASLIFYSTPLVIWLSGTTYMDLAEACFVVSALVAFVCWDRESKGWLIASGVIAGVAAGTKIQALTVLGVLPIAIIWHSRKISRRAVLANVGVFVLALTIVAAPWYAIIYAFTGNPVYPFMNATFRSAQWAAENTTLDAANFGIGRTAGSLLRLPFRFTWDTTRFGQSLPRGGAGFALLLAFPLAITLLFVPRYRRGNAGLVFAACALHLTCWALSVQYGRYYIPALPLVALLGCTIILQSTWSNLRINRVLLFAGVLAQVPVASIQYWNIPERYPLAHALGRETDAALLRRGLVGYGAAEYVDKVIKPGEKVIGVEDEDLRFYLDGPLYSLAEAPYQEEFLTIANLKPGKDLASGLSRAGFAYIVVPLTELKKPALFHHYLQPNFVQGFSELEYHDEAFAVLHICPAGCAPTDSLTTLQGTTGSSGEQGSVQSGYVIVTPDNSSVAPSTKITFGILKGGVMWSQVDALGEPMTDDASFAFERVPTVRQDLSLAIANPSLQPNTLTLSLRGAQGTIVGEPVTVSLSAGQQLAKYVTEWFPADVIATRSDLNLRLQSPVPFSILGFRFLDTSFSTIRITESTETPGVPTRQLNGAKLGGSNALIVPQFAMGGGWTTQIALSNTTTATIRGRVDIFDTSGNPMAVKLNGVTQSTFSYVIPARITFILAPRDANGKSLF